MAVVWRMTGGEMCWGAGLGQAARARWLACGHRGATPSRDRALPWAPGNALRSACAPRAAHPGFNTWLGVGPRGTVRSVRPWPVSGPTVLTPQHTCWHVSAVISETRAPLLYRVKSRV